MQIDTTAVIEQAGNKKKRNSVSFGGQMKSYFLHPGSGILAFLTTLAAVITFALLFFLIGYILVKGIPYLNADLFSPEYTSENVSLVPSLINTFIMTVISLAIAAPLGIFAAIYLVEYAKKGSKFVNVIRLTAETLSGHNTEMGNVHFIRCIYDGDHDSSPYYAYCRRGFKIRSGLLQRGKLWSWRRKTPNHF